MIVVELGGAGMIVVDSDGAGVGAADGGGGSGGVCDGDGDGNDNGVGDVIGRNVCIEPNDDFLGVNENERKSL